MSDILRQIDEDLRKDRLLNIWKSYRIFIISSILTILITLSGYQYYLASTKSKNENIVEMYVDAINSTGSENSINKLIKLDQSENFFINGLAKLKKAELYYNSENVDQALKILEQVSNDKKLNQVIRDLALYKYLMVQLDVLDTNEYLKTIDSQRIKESKFKYLFKELKALKYLVEENYIESLEIFNSIILDELAPSDLKERAKKFIKISKQ